MNLAIDFSTLAGVSAINVFITEAIVKSCKVTKNWVKQLISWATPLLLCVVGLLCQFGLFAEYGGVTDWHAWIYTVVTGLGLGLVSNGLYDIPFIQQFLEWLVKLFNKKKQQEKDRMSEIPVGVIGETKILNISKDLTKKEHDDIRDAVKKVINDDTDEPLEHVHVDKKVSKKSVAKKTTSPKTKN